MSNLSKLLGGDGSQGPGDVIPSFGDDAAMLDRGFLPCRGGTLLQADYPDLFAGVGYRENKLLLTPGVTRTATVDAGYYNPCVAYPVVTGGLNILAMMSASTSYVWHTYVSISTGAAVGSDTSATTDDLRGFRAIGDALYCGAYNGRATKRTGATLATEVVFPSTYFPVHGVNNAVLDFWEINGYLVVGTELGIVRCALADDITDVANWTHVHSRSMSSNALINGGVNTSNFTYDADIGRLFFRSHASHYLLYSDDDGATWTEVYIANTGSYGTKVVKWNGAHWILPGITPIASTTPTDAQTRVWKSTDGGATWEVSSMLAKGTMTKMQPFVAGNVLYMGWLTTSTRFLIYGYRQEYEGLKEPSDDATAAPIFLAWDSGPTTTHLSTTSFHEITGEVFPVGANYVQADNASPVIQTVSFGYDIDTEFALPDLTDQPTPYFIKT